MSVNVEGEDVRFFHTSKSGVERIWIDRCSTKALHAQPNRMSGMVDAAFSPEDINTPSLASLDLVCAEEGGCAVVCKESSQSSGLLIAALAAQSLGHRCLRLRSPLFLAKVWGQTGSKLYGAKSGSDYVDNQRRFRIFNEVSSNTQGMRRSCAKLSELLSLSPLPMTTSVVLRSGKDCVGPEAFRLSAKRDFALIL